MKSTSEKSFRIFRTSEASRILGIAEKTLSQWQVRGQFTLDDPLERDDFRYSYFDMLRLMLIDELRRRFGVPVSQAAKMVEKLRDGISGRFLNSEGLVVRRR